jgi:hypothetical protein
LSSSNAAARRSFISSIFFIDWYTLRFA